MCLTERRRKRKDLIFSMLRIDNLSEVHFNTILKGITRTFYNIFRRLGQIANRRLDTAHSKLAK